MTGFGRTEGSFQLWQWVWELRAVNGKGMDMRLRLPQGFEGLEQPVRKLAKNAISRGNVQAVLTVQADRQMAPVQINENALEAVLKAVERIGANDAIKPSSAAEILSIRGVMEVGEPEVDEDTKSQLETELLSGFEQAVDALNAHRLAEGSNLADILLGQLDQVEKLTHQAENDPNRTETAIKERLERQLEAARNADIAIDEARLAQELAIILTKADIREELDRLVAHVSGARGLIRNGSPVGRKLEFLAQEFNRESNTLCSKSNAVSITETGLELKVVIDQFREQCLNVE